MIAAIKIIFILIIVFLLSYPFIPATGKLRKFFIASSLKYRAPNNRKNVFFALLASLVFIIMTALFKLFEWFAQLICGIPFVGTLISKGLGGLNSQVDYILFVIQILLINIVAIYLFSFLKLILRRAVINPIFHLGNGNGTIKRKGGSKNNKNDGEQDSSEGGDTAIDKANNADDEKLRKRRRIPDFLHSAFEDDGVDDEDGKEGDSEKKKREYGLLESKFLSLFFEGSEFQFVKTWAVRARVILQFFIRIIQVVYLLFIITMLLSVFFALPAPIYNLLINVIKIKNWYVYPVISLIFLQEICNVFDAHEREPATPEEKKLIAEKRADRKREARMRALLAELKKRFDSEHSLRYYPEISTAEVPEYKCTNVMYASALAYIGNQMRESSGKTVHSYMECLDAIYRDENVYFSASFYSELGEYLIAYTYTRLLSGARMIFIVSDHEEKDTLRRFIRDRLMKMTGSDSSVGWRVYTVGERLEQADVLIASPEDFIDSNIVEQHPAFFEEACNAVFIDVDRAISLSSYICPIIATKLQNITDGRIRFIFLSLDLLKGFAAGSLPRFFCVDKVLSFSSAGESEAVSYVLWNKESKRHRIYNKGGQKTSCLETIIAEQACRYGMDGVRLITEAPLEHAERKNLATHDVEINNLYKNIVDVNYMIYSDDRCNLASALYACTRFRGKKKSVVHILSKPYLLREYFMSKMTIEDYINRSSFIQPRVTEHAQRHKLSLLCIFCDATFDKGMVISEFERRVKDVIIAAIERQDLISSVYCRRILAEKSINELKLSELAAYVIAGICDNDVVCTPAEEDSCAARSVGNRAKDYYIIVDPARYGTTSLIKEKRILFNRSKEVYNYLLKNNKRVELCLNDKIIGRLDTFPDRVHLEYIEGQNIIFNNAEYEIERVSSDGTMIYLRRENIGIKNCLDTFLLRNYDIKSITAGKKTAVLNNSKSMLEEIRVTKCKAALTAQTYGFYSLTSDRQTLDFKHGVEGNSHAEHPHVREYANADVLRVTLKSRQECNDGMRLLMAAVFNEFIRTIFPKAYRCIAICPILESPITGTNDRADATIAEHVKTLYPYLNSPTEEFVETDKNRMQFLFINDCREDVGVLDWFYDPSARYMQEFLANVYSYLYWLSNKPNKQHYIYFGGEGLPECYDLNGCCDLLSDFNLILSDDGKKDFETAGDDSLMEKTEYCSFCHKPMESGRYSFFDKHRFICADCFDTIDERSRLEQLYLQVKEYLVKQYPETLFGSVNVKFDAVYDLTEEQQLSEFYYRIDYTDRTVYVELDNPINNVCVSLLRGILSFWQTDSDLANTYASAQLYYEEMCYLRSIGESISSDWVYENVPDDVRVKIDEIIKYIEGDETSDDESTDDEVTSEDTVIAPEDKRTSFMFMRLKGKESHIEYDVDDMDDNEEYSDDLYDPNMIPRFWKRYLRKARIDDGSEEEIPEEAFIGNDDESADESDEEPADEDSTNESKTNQPNSEIKLPYEGVITMLKPNAPPMNDEGEIVSLDKKAEKKRKKEERKQQKEEKKKQKQLEKEQRRNKHNESPTNDEDVENDEGAVNDDEAPKSKKGLFSLFKRNKKDKKNKDSEDKDSQSDDSSEDDVADKDDVTNDISDDMNDADVDDTLNDEAADDESLQDDTDGGKSKKDKSKQKKGDKGDKKKKSKDKGKKILGKDKEIIPHEDDEDTNPKIRLYNNIVRAAYSYSEKPIPLDGVNVNDVNVIFNYVRSDYPELFWLLGLEYIIGGIVLTYRCRDANGRLDVKQINRKRKELAKGAKYFTRGITRKTDPYQALLTIYRRLITTLDYDGVGLDNRVDVDQQRDDALRSLHSALVTHKVVCAGYAVAMQYLLQSVGIVCGYVTSEDILDGTCHAFNTVKIGKYCYYLDVTWGDISNTKSKDNNNYIFYDYFCVPFDEFTRTLPERVPLHCPRKEYYPNVEKFRHTNHEYYRYHNAYLTNYKETEIIRIMKETAERYDAEEMGDFSIGIRFSTPQMAEYAEKQLTTNGAIFRLLQTASKQLAKKDKKAAKLLNCEKCWPVHNLNAGVLNFFLSNNNSDNKKKRK